MGCNSGNDVHLFAGMIEFHGQLCVIPGVVGAVVANDAGDTPYPKSVSLLFATGEDREIRARTFNLDKSSTNLLPSKVKHDLRQNGRPLQTRFLAKHNSNRPLVHIQAVTLSNGVVIRSETTPFDLRPTPTKLQMSSIVDYAMESFASPPISPDFSENDCYRMYHKPSSGIYIDRFAKCVVVRVDVGENGEVNYRIGKMLEIAEGLNEEKNEAVERIYGYCARYHRGDRNNNADFSKPTLLYPRDAIDEIMYFDGVENGLKHNLVIGKEKYSTGLYMDQRDLRAWIKMRESEKEGGTLLNLFSHSNSFSNAAYNGAGNFLTTNVDIDKFYLSLSEQAVPVRSERASRESESEECYCYTSSLCSDRIANSLQQIPPNDNIFGDAVDWVQKLSKRGEKFDIVVIDPPSTATSGKGKKRKRFTVKDDYEALVAHSAKMMPSEGGLIVAITNYRKMTTLKFIDTVLEGISKSDRSGRLKFWVAPGGDFAYEREADECQVKTLVFEVK